MRAARGACLGTPQEHTGNERAVMNIVRRWKQIGGMIILGGALLLGTGGCPIDEDALATEVVDAALQSITTSLVDALSNQLAQN